MNVFVTGASGYIGGSVAAALARAGHRVRGLVRSADKAAGAAALGIDPVIATLDDAERLAAEARAADAVINAASSDHRGAADALLDALAGSGKTLVHTSGSSIVSDGADGEPTDTIWTEARLPEPTPDKVARVALDRAVLAGNERGLRAIVLCCTMIYGHGRGPGRDSVQVPRLAAHARATGRAGYIGRGLNAWSNVHIDDVVDLYVRALGSAAPGGFHFVESGEAELGAIAHAIGRRLGQGPAASLSPDEAGRIWGHEMARHALGSNSRVRAQAVRDVFGWTPRATSITDWIEREL